MGGGTGNGASNGTSDGTSDAAKGPRSQSLAALLNGDRAEGLTIEDLQVGSGVSAQMGDAVRVHYVGRLENGKEFDSSRNRPGTFDFSLGRGMVIRGFERGVVGMKVGGLRRIHIPWALGYGDRGSPPQIPPKANLIFEVELVDIPVPEQKKAPKAPPGAPPSGPPQ